MSHYTSQSQDVFTERIVADFIGQIAQQLESKNMPQIELARKLGVSESEVSQVLNLNRLNLTLRKMTGLAFALGMKLAVVAYNDLDPNNNRGPVGSTIFSQCWENQGRPRNVKSAIGLRDQASTFLIRGWQIGWMNNTLAHDEFSGNTSGNLQIPTPILNESVWTKEIYARS